MATEMTWASGTDVTSRNQDLCVLGTAGPREQGKPAEHPQHREVDKS
ncbi:MAG: hypothetical protein ACRDP7_45255 [Trebonia sp.]